MKAQTKSATLKKQLLSAVSMMLAAAVALGSSTYAWFVNKSRAEVKDVLFQASAGKNLEIAGAVVESTNASKFSGLNEKDQVPQGKANLLTYYSSVTPQLLGENSFTYPQYENGTAVDGKYMTPLSIDGSDIKLTPGSTTFFEANDWDSTATSGASAVGAYYKYSTVVGNDGEKYICAQMYFRSSTDMDVYLNKTEWQNFSTGDENAVDTTPDIPFITYYNPTGADADNIAAYKQEAKDMASALRIAFVTGEITDGGSETTSDVKVAAFTTNNINGAYYNTSSAQTTGGAVKADDRPIKTLDTDNTAKEFGTAVTDTLEKYTLTNASSGTPNETDVTTEAGTKTPLFHLEANKPKRVTVYIWLEGADQDCVSALSAFRAGVYLPFVGAIENGDKVVTYSLDEDVEVVEEPEVVEEVVEEAE